MGDGLDRSMKLVDAPTKVYGGRRGYTCKGTPAVLTEHHAEHNNIRTINLIYSSLSAARTPCIPRGVVQR